MKIKKQLKRVEKLRTSLKNSTFVKSQSVKMMAAEEKEIDELANLAKSAIRRIEEFKKPQKSLKKVERELTKSLIKAISGAEYKKLQ